MFLGIKHKQTYLICPIHVHPNISLLTFPDILCCLAHSNLGTRFVYLRQIRFKFHSPLTVPLPHITLIEFNFKHQV